METLSNILLLVKLAYIDYIIKVEIVSGIDFFFMVIIFIY